MTNFLTRLFVSATFIILIVALPVRIAVIGSVIWGLLVLTVMTYLIVKHQKINPCSAILVHITLAVIVVAASNFIGAFVISKFQT
jgi:hypothetical protein